MAIFSLGDKEPQVHSEAYVHPDATLIGDVRIGKGSSVWPQAVLRADWEPIIVGERTSIQDGTVIHVASTKPTTIGNDCVIGHLVHLEGCTIGNRVLIGVGAIVRHDCVINDESIVGANAMVRDGTVVPSRNRALGVPAKVAPGVVDVEDIKRIAQIYVDNAKTFKEQMKRID